MRRPYLTYIGHLRQHIYCTAIGVPVLKMTTSAESFPNGGAARCPMRVYAAQSEHAREVVDLRRQLADHERLLGGSCSHEAPARPP